MIRKPRGIDATTKLDDYPDRSLSSLWYGNIYALPEFGKTKYGTLMEISKTHPSLSVFDRLFESFNQTLQHCVDYLQVDALCFAQPTVKRSMQIMYYAQDVLLPKIPRVRVRKVKGYFPPQKTLKHRIDRIGNAHNSFEIERVDTKKIKYNTVLIIDDAVGLGATLNEIGTKLKEGGLAQKVYGFSMIGTANGIFNQIKKVGSLVISVNFLTIALQTS